ncbi:MAG: hypothetical protein H0V03_05900 [Thermoleophilaceae bacterium]|nr:hypothetical protein [Thermoleophilaceae bacterium]
MSALTLFFLLLALVGGLVAGGVRRRPRPARARRVPGARVDWSGRDPAGPPIAEPAVFVPDEQAWTL